MGVRFKLLPDYDRFCGNGIKEDLRQIASTTASTKNLEYSVS